MQIEIGSYFKNLFFFPLKYIILFNYRIRENKFSTIKESLFETIDIYTTSFENTKQFIQSIPKAVNDLQQIPSRVQSYFKSIENGLVGIQSNLIAIKNKFRGLNIIFSVTIISLFNFPFILIRFSRMEAFR
jgi:hypothetical protein